MSCLHHHAYKWEVIGRALGFHDGEIKNISHSYPRYTVEQLLMEVLSKWSQWPTEVHESVPTIESLRDALHSSMVELGAAADDIYALRDSLPSKKRRNTVS